MKGKQNLFRETSTGEDTYHLTVLKRGRHIKNGLGIFWERLEHRNEEYVGKQHWVITPGQKVLTDGKGQ